MKREAESRSVASKKRDGTKARDIYKQYPKSKADDLIKRLREKNLWAYDEDFDGDSEDWCQPTVDFNLMLKERSSYSSIYSAIIGKNLNQIYIYIYI